MRRPSWPMSSTTLSATKKSASLVRLQAENGSPCSAGLDFAIFLISRRSGSAKVFGRPPLYFRVEGVEAVGVEVVDHIPDPVSAGERDLSDLRHRHALHGQQHHPGSAPGHHRPDAAADDPQQQPPFVAVDLSAPARVPPSEPPVSVSCDWCR
nr:hypothetical protein [Streptomyces taklimakanensis]